MPAAVLGLALLAALQGGVHAGQKAGGAAGSGESSSRDFREWLEAFRAEARRAGISEQTLDAALGDVSPIRRVIELDRRQPEFIQPLWMYLDRRVTRERVRRGRELLLEYRGLLDEIYAEYGVPPRYLIAFWGLETNFGDHLGGFAVIDALATLAYDRRRAGFFRSELLHALQIIEQGHIRPGGMIGSWAGAMGHMQFLPSTFTGHAVDYTGDGRKDIWGSLPDAFASAANFLSDVGWRRGETWGRQVRLPEGFDLAMASMDRKKTLRKWSELGVRRADGAPLPRADMEGSVILPQGRRGPAFLVYDNFRAVMRWNRSINYAISVCHLADRIIGKPPIRFSPDERYEPLPRAGIIETQRLLKRLGFDAGPADGLPGPETRSAIRAFQRQHGLPPDGYPTLELLRRLRAQVGR